MTTAQTTLSALSGAPTIHHPPTPNSDPVDFPVPRTMRGLTFAIKEALKLAQADGTIAPGEPGDPGPEGPAGLQGPTGPQGPAGAISRAEPWSRDRRYAKDAIVTYFSGCWQCRANTDTEPGQSEDWVCVMNGVEAAELTEADEPVLVRSDGSRITVKGVLRGRDGREWQHRGTYDPNGWYVRSDVVVLRGTSYVAIEDTPGGCPGSGWRMIAQAKSGPSGRPGMRGE